MEGVRRNGWPSRYIFILQKKEKMLCCLATKDHFYSSYFDRNEGKLVHLLDNHVSVGGVGLPSSVKMAVINAIHLFCVQYVFIPRLRADLQHFTDSWNNHPISIEANLTPQQMWQIGMLQAPVPEPNYAEVGM